MTTIRRTYTYLLALAGLLVSVAAAAGMASLIVSTLTLPAGAIRSSGDARTQASLYLAELVVALPVWLGHWLAAERSVTRKPDERQAVQRRLFLAAVFVVTSLVALLALHDLLRFLLTLPGAQPSPAALDGAIRATTRFLAFGAAWIGYARLERPRPAGQDGVLAMDRAHDLAVYILTGVALAFLLTGVVEATLEITRNVLATGQADLLPASHQRLWTIWGAIAAWTLAGGSIWALIWRYDLTRAGRRDLRILYLYLVLIVAAPVTLGGGADGLYELLRRLFGYQAATGYREFLPGVLAALLAGGATWLYHWRILRRQARYAGETLTTVQPSVAAARTDGAGTGPGDVGPTIAWPRRFGLALLALVGLAASALALVSLLWLGLDFQFNSGDTLAGPDWWRDRLSASLAAGAIGVAVWLGAWWRLQRAAAVQEERSARERRVLLGFVTLAGALVTFGMVIALLWLGFRALLGAPLNPHALSTALKEASGALVALVLAAYHGTMLRTEVRLAPRGAGPLRVRVLVGPGTEALLAALRQERDLHLDVAGQLLDDGPGEPLTVPALLQLAALRETAVGEEVLMVLRTNGGIIYRYRH